MHEYSFVIPDDWNMGVTVGVDFRPQRGGMKSDTIEIAVDNQSVVLTALQLKVLFEEYTEWKAGQNEQV